MVTQINVRGLLRQNTFLAQINTTERIFGKNMRDVPFVAGTLN